MSPAYNCLILELNRKRMCPFTKCTAY